MAELRGAVVDDVGELNENPDLKRRLHMGCVPDRVKRLSLHLCMRVTGRELQRSTATVSVRRGVGLHVRRRVLQRLQCVMGTSPSACRSRDDCAASSADDSDAAPRVVSAAKIAARLIVIASAFSVAP